MIKRVALKTESGRQKTKVPQLNLPPPPLGRVTARNRVVLLAAVTTLHIMQQDVCNVNLQQTLQDLLIGL